MSPPYIHQEIQEHDSYWQELKVGGLYCVRYAKDGPYPGIRNALALDSYVVSEQNCWSDLGDIRDRVVLIVDLDLKKPIRGGNTPNQFTSCNVDIHFLLEEKLGIIRTDYWANWKKILRPVDQVYVF